MLATQSVRAFYDWKGKLFFSSTFLDLVDTLIKIYRQACQIIAIMVSLRNCYFTSTHRRCIRLVNIIRSHYTISEYNMHDYRGIKFHPSLSSLSRLNSVFKKLVFTGKFVHLTQTFSTFEREDPVRESYPSGSGVKIVVEDDDYTAERIS